MCNLARVGYGYIHHLIDYKPVEIEEKGGKGNRSNGS